MDYSSAVLKFNFQVLVCGYFYFLLFYTSTPQHLNLHYSLSNKQKTRNVKESEKKNPQTVP